MNGAATMTLDDQDHEDLAARQRPVLFAILTALLYAAVALPALTAGEVGKAGLADMHGATLPLAILLAGVLIALSTIDAQTFQLPDALTLPLAAAGILIQASAFGPRSALIHLLAAVAAFVLVAGLARLYHAARGRAGIGLGDAKLFAAAGAWLGLAALPSVLVLATGAALASVAVARLRQGALALTDAIPFGPYLAFAIWLVWLYGPVIANG